MDKLNASDRLRPYVPQMIADRRWFHTHPELSGQEVQTMDYITQTLESLGLGVHIVPAGGVIGVLNGSDGDEGPCVLLRADCDALPIVEDEKNTVEKRTCLSQTPGVMHACGHDAHMAMLLATARALVEQAEGMRGRVLFVFEQGEERGGQGFLCHLLPYIEAHFRVDVCYAAHVRWDIPAGKMAILDGAVMAGAFGFDITLHGRGGHGSRPDLATSPIDCFCAIHTHLQELRMRVTEPDKVLTYSLGQVMAGERANTIPNSLRFAGTVRTFDTAGSGECFAREMRKGITALSALYGCEAELKHFSNPLYEVNNHPKVAELARKAVCAHMGEQSLTACKPWMASESMSAYLKLWPGVLTFLGIRNEELGAGANHHTPRFDLDESAMLSGAAATYAFVWDVMNQHPNLAFERQIVSMDDLVSRSI